MNKSDVLIISNHHRRSPFFEDSMKRLWDDGYKNIIIQETGGRAWGSYRGPYSLYIGGGTIPYDTGMVNFKRSITGDYDLIVLLDNDLFLSGTNHFNQYLEDFERGEYDFACHHVSASCYTQDYKFDGCIAPVPKQEFEPADVYPGFCPNPHWENAYLLIKKSMWDRLSEDDVSHGRKWIKAVVRENAKLGAHQANYRLTYSHFGDEWFHVGNLMAYYYRLERSQAFHVDSELDMSRLGYFLYMATCYPGSVPNNIMSKLKQASGEALDAWHRLTSGTCMENWEKF